MLGRIDWIFFDVGSTLVDERVAYRRCIDDAVRGTDISHWQFLDTMLAYYGQNKKGDLEAVRHYGRPLPTWHLEAERLYPEAKGCLQALSAAYRLGVIANQSLGTKARLRAFGVLEHFDLVVASAEEGVEKPDPRIFTRALERAGCAPQNAAMIGDRLDNDIAPAKALGMKTVWVRQGFARYTAPRTDLEQADYVVESLAELRGIFLPCP